MYKVLAQDPFVFNRVNSLDNYRRKIEGQNLLKFCRFSDGNYLSARKGRVEECLEKVSVTQKATSDYRH